MTAFGATLERLATSLTGAFSTKSDETEHGIRTKELADVQATHDFTAIHIQNCFNPDKPSFSGSETLLKLLQEFYVSYDTPTSKLNSSVRVPILHNKSFEVFYRLQKAGYQPVADGEENKDFSSAGIVRHAVGVAMRDMEKFAGMNGDYNAEEMKLLGDRMLDFRAQYLRQHAIENPEPRIQKT